MTEILSQTKMSPNDARYGPYLVPNMTDTSGWKQEPGMLADCGDADIEKPCDTCTIVRVAPDLEYADGKIANMDTGMWLHHVSLLSQVDSNC
jgi:hypothetical protein